MALSKKEIEHFKGEMPKGVKIIDINRESKSIDEYGIWDFVEQFHPDYSTCFSVAYSNDLQKIVDGEGLEENSEALNIYNDISIIIDTKDPKEIIRHANQLLLDTNAYCMKRAIQGFIDLMKS